MVETGISFSGGGARGVAHIGVMKALEELGIQPQIFSGTSMGAIIGALFANGYTVDEMIEIARSQKNINIFRWNTSTLGITSHASIHEILTKLLPETFEELKYPLYVSTTNLNTTKNVLFSSGPLIDPVLASMSIPVVFNPIKIDGHLYVDGGLSKNLPAKILRDKCEVLIGSHVNRIDPSEKLKSLKSIAERCFRIAIHNSVLEDKELCDFYVNPAEIRKYETLNFKLIPEIIDIGYHGTRHKLKSEPELFENKSFIQKIAKRLK